MQEPLGVEAHLLEEASAVERFTARLRLQALIVLVPVVFIALVLGGFPTGFVAAGVVGSAGYLLVALGVDRVVRRARYRPWFPYATVTIDVVWLTVMAILGGSAVGSPTLGLKSPLVVAFFTIIALAALRQSERVAAFSGVVTAAAYAALVLPVTLADPQLLHLQGGVYDLDEPGVSVVRIVIVTTMLLVAGGIAAIGASRTRHLVARALDTVTFLFADLRDYTPFLETRGDAAGAALVAEYRRTVRAEIARTGGREVKTEGDSFLVAFGSARQALECATGILRAADAARSSRPDLPLSIGIGLNAGEPVVQEGDYVGLAVNIAARLGQQARAGELLVSEIVRGLLTTGDAPPMTVRRDLILKGISDQPTAYAVAWSHGSSA